MAAADAARGAEAGRTEGAVGVFVVGLDGAVVPPAVPLEECQCCTLVQVQNVPARIQRTFEYIQGLSGSNDITGRSFGSYLTGVAITFKLGS